jgi:hypothetical protein
VAQPPASTAAPRVAARLLALRGHGLGHVRAVEPVPVPPLCQGIEIRRVAAPAVQAGGERHRRDVGQLEQDRLVDADGENPAVRRIEGQRRISRQTTASKSARVRPARSSLLVARLLPLGLAGVPGSDGGAVESTGATFCPSDLGGAICDAEDRGPPPEGWPWHARCRVWHVANDTNKPTHPEKLAPAQQTIFYREKSPTGAAHDRGAPGGGSQRPRRGTSRASFSRERQGDNPQRATTVPNDTTMLRRPRPMSALRPSDHVRALGSLSRHGEIPSSPASLRNVTG